MSKRPHRYEMNRYDCGCKVIHDCAGCYYVQWCSLHEAASELLEALRDVAAYLRAIELPANQIGETGAIRTKLATIDAAIAKAEKGE